MRPIRLIAGGIRYPPILPMLTGLDELRHPGDRVTIHCDADNGPATPRGYSATLPSHPPSTPADRPP